MRPTLFNALVLTLSASLCFAVSVGAAEAPSSGGGSQKTGKRSAESDKKPAAPAQPTSGAGTGTAGEPTKRKTTASKPAAVKAGSEDERFANARKAAAEDPKIVELREKADQAKTKEAGEKAMRSYLRALYGKMRTLEPSLEDRINLTEAAALKAVSKGE